MECKLPQDLSFSNILLLKGRPSAGLPVLGQVDQKIGEEMIRKRHLLMARLQAKTFQDLGALDKAQLSVLAVISVGELVSLPCKF